MLELGNDWDDILKEETSQNYYQELKRTLSREYREYTIYPEVNSVFNSFKYCPYSKTKVVLLGQDPYMNPGEAHGLSFSVQRGTTIPPSLRNIFKELYDDLGIQVPNHGELTSWAEQGVLLINSIMTVRKGQAGSHKGIGWELFTDNVIRYLNRKDTPVVFLLWGNFAKRKDVLITNGIHEILTSVHPSPLAGKGFFGNKHFSKTNDFLVKNGMDPIDWNLV